MKNGFTSLGHPAFRTYIATTALLVVCSALGFAGVGFARWLFMIGCILLGIMAWRDSPGRHLEVTIILFAFTPFVRRVIDVRTGYDLLGVMLSGPLLTMLVACIDLRKLMNKPNAFKDMGPFLLAGVCLIYGAMISLFVGDFQAIMIQLLKWGTPLLYGMWMLNMSQDPRNDMISHASRAFLVVTPIMGIYGIEQYLDPAPWDRFWMIYSLMDSIGQPEPFAVRVFSTMNSPASFATFATVGLLVFSFTRRGWQAALIGVTVALALMLSQSRTAWIAMGIGLIYGWLFPKTRGRSTGIAVIAFIAVVVGVTAGGPIGDVLSQRFDTLSSGSNDGSAIERWSEYIGLYALSEQYIMGRGFTVLAGVNAGFVALDGTIISAYLIFGLFVGTIFLIALCWAAIVAISKIKLNDSSVRVATGAVVLGLILTMPLAGITSGESGFLFWTFVAIATGTPLQSLQLQFATMQPNRKETRIFQ